MMVIDGYTVDAELTGEPTYSSEVTKYPIESGGKRADHIQPQPVGFSCEGIVSDTPIGAMVTEREIQGLVGGETPSRDAHERFVQIHLNREPVTVTSALGTFDLMAMTSYVPRRDGGSLRFTATFEQLSIVENERTVVRVAVPRAAKKDTFRNIPTEYTDERGRAVFRDVIKSGPLKGTSVYKYKDGTPVPDAVVDKATKDAGAVRVKYVNGQSVPVYADDYQPYTKTKERPFWPDDDKAAPTVRNLSTLVGGKPF